MSKNGLVVGRLLIRVVGHQILKRKKGSNVKSRYYCVALHKPKTFFYIDLASLTTANANHTFDIDSPYGFHSQIVCHIRQRTTSQRKLSLQYRHANSQSALFNQPYTIDPIKYDIPALGALGPKQGYPKQGYPKQGYPKQGCPKQGCP